MNRHPEFLFPEEIWIMILEMVTDVHTIHNILLAFPSISTAVTKKKASWLIDGAMPRLLEYINQSDYYSIRSVSRRWSSSLDQATSGWMVRVRGLPEMDRIDYSQGALWHTKFPFGQPTPLVGEDKLGQFIHLVSGQPAHRSPFKGGCVDIGAPCSTMDPTPIFWEPIATILDKYGHHIRVLRLGWNTFTRNPDGIHPTYFNLLEFINMLCSQVFRKARNIRTLILKGYGLEMDAVSDSIIQKGPSKEIGSQFPTLYPTTLEGLDMIQLHVPTNTLRWILMSLCDQISELGMRVDSASPLLDQDIGPFRKLSYLKLQYELPLERLGGVLQNWLARTPFLSTLLIFIEPPLTSQGLGNPSTRSCTIDRDILHWLSPFPQLRNLHICGVGIKLSESSSSEEVDRPVRQLTSIKSLKLGLMVDDPFREPLEGSNPFPYRFLLKMPNLVTLYLTVRGAEVEPSPPTVPRLDVLLDVRDVYNSQIWEALPALQTVKLGRFVPFRPVSVTTFRRQ